jgi:hypothetical protein
MLFIFSWLFFACGIQTFEDLSDLNPPHALQVTIDGRTLHLSFVTFNYEKNFSGFNIFIGTDSTEVSRRARVLPNVRTEREPTFITNNNYFRDEPKRITLTLTENFRNIEPLKSTGERFWIGVTAYDAVYRLNSRTSAPVYVDWSQPQSSPP